MKQPHLELLAFSAHNCLHAWEMFPAVLTDNWHYHPEIELTLLVRGQGTRFVGDSIVSFGDGDLVLLGSGLPHCWRNVYGEAPSGDTSAHAMVLWFAPNFLGPGTLDKAEFVELRRLLERSARGLVFDKSTRRVVGRMLRELPHTQGLDQVIRVLRILSRLSAGVATPLSSAAWDTRLLRGRSARLDQITDYVLAHMAVDISLEQISAQVRMSKSSFSHFFRRATGKTFTDFVNEVRLSRVAKMLVETDLDVSQIAYTVGFSTLSHFNALFRKVHGCSPRAYRRRVTPHSKSELRQGR